MRILKLFKKHVLALFAAIVLIVISCNADLALPTYMSDIVDVGVQQGGIASPVPDTIRAESLDDLELFMSAKDAKAVEAVFSKADKNGIRTYKGTEEERADGSKLADIMSLPETVVLSLNQGIDADSMGDMTGASTEASDGGAAQAMPTPEQMAAMTPEQLAEMQQKATAAQNMQKQIDADGGKITMKSLRLGIEGGLVDQSKLVESANEMADKMGSMSGSIVTQRAVTYVQEEYKAQGIDPADVQNAYLGRMATTMFGLCLVSLVATILTGAVASRTACSIARDLRRETFNKVMHFSPAEVGKFSQASLITRCTNDIQQIPDGRNPVYPHVSDGPRHGHRRRHARPGQPYRPGVDHRRCHHRGLGRRRRAHGPHHAQVQKDAKLRGPREPYRPRAARRPYAHPLVQPRGA